ncbi:2-phosphosulfolactate phosphatase [Agromyces sp. NPDC049794]|uniref:2-phosphosulfolactate phosphatase n=1 Tax=unclassified Agromyces TaxID=2639701 RepID=UPI0033D9FCDA
MSDSTTPFGQAKYQVRFDWGASGAGRIVPGVHVVVLADALLFTTGVVVAAEQGAETRIDGPDAAAASAVIDASLATVDDPIVLAASLRNRTAVAERILALQEERGERMLVAVVAVGDTDRLTIEDQLTAGAVVDALVGLGLDHTSPEAAVASAAFEGLRRALVHLIGASGSGVELTADGRKAEVRLATRLDVTRVVPELHEGVFRV